MLFSVDRAEANEAAIKLARKHTQKNVMITFEQSFHVDIRRHVCDWASEGS